MPFDYNEPEIVRVPKLNALLPLTGGTLTGTLITKASAATAAGLRLPHGIAPTAPVNGDLWTTTAGIYARINGATVGPFGGGVTDGDKGDITVTGSGATWTIDPGVVSLAKMADVATATVFYRKTAGTGVPEVQTLATLKTDLGLTGTNSGDQTITLTGDVTGSGTGSFAATIANLAVTTAKVADDAITYAKLQNAAAGNVVLARAAATSGDYGEVALAASQLLGRGSTGDVAAISLGTGLAMSGTTLSASSDWTTVKLAADFTNNTVTFTDVSDGTTTLTFTPPASSDWEMEACILFVTSVNTNLTRIGINSVSGVGRGTGGVNLWQPGATANTSVSAHGAWDGTSGDTTVQMAAGGVVTANVPYLCEIRASGRSGGTPTAITIQMAAESGAGTHTVKRGSFLKYRTVA